MSTLSPKDRVSLCMFSFADGRRCRTPRIRNHPHFCYDHAEKEARARATQSLGTDLARYFSGQYLSACDLSTALGCLIPAVIRGDVKPKVARTVAYMAQTLLQSIHISQHEYCEAFGPDTWRNSIRTSVHGNHIYRFPPQRSGGRNSSRSEIPTPSGPGREAGVAPQPQHPSNAKPKPQPSAPTSPAQQSAPPKPAPTPVNCHSARPDLVGERSDERPTRCASPESFREESAFSSSPASAPPTTQAPQPASPPHNPLPPTGAEFAQQVLARHNSSRPDRARSVRPGETAGQQTGQPVTSNPKPTPPTQAPPTSAANAAPPANNTPPVPATQVVQPTVPATQPAGPAQGQTNNSPNPKPPTPNRAPHKDHYAVHTDYTCPLRVDGKLV
jgi:hypothetical protein